MPTRKQRGHETETAVARYLQAHGWPFAEPVGAGRNGSDVTGIPGLSIEIKARRDLNLTGWLKQARPYVIEPDPEAPGYNRGREVLPMVCHRPDGFGIAKVELWPVTFRLADAVRLLRAAGYGTEEKWM